LKLLLQTTFQSIYDTPGLHYYDIRICTKEQHNMCYMTRTIYCSLGSEKKVDDILYIYVDLYRGF
jgi:hypothetical protein